MNLRQSVDSSIQELETRVRVLDMEKQSLEMRLRSVELQQAHAYGALSALQDVVARSEIGLDTLFMDANPEDQVESVHDPLSVHLNGEPPSQREDVDSPDDPNLAIVDF